MVHLHNGILRSRKKEGAPTLFDSMDGPGEHYAKRNKPGGERKLCFLRVQVFSVKGSLLNFFFKWKLPLESSLICIQNVSYGWELVSQRGSDLLLGPKGRKSNIFSCSWVTYTKWPLSHYSPDISVNFSKLCDLYFSWCSCLFKILYKKCRFVHWAWCVSCIGLNVFLQFVQVAFRVALGQEQREGNCVSRDGVGVWECWGSTFLYVFIFPSPNGSLVSGPWRRQS